MIAVKDFERQEDTVRRWAAAHPWPGKPALTATSYADFLAWCFDAGIPQDERPHAALWGILCYRLGLVEVPEPKERSDRRKAAKRGGGA